MAIPALKAFGKSAAVSQLGLTDDDDDEESDV